MLNWKKELKEEIEDNDIVAEQTYKLKFMESKLNEYEKIINNENKIKKSLNQLMKEDNRFA